MLAASAAVVTEEALGIPVALPPSSWFPNEGYATAGTPHPIGFAGSRMSVPQSLPERVLPVVTEWSLQSVRLAMFLRASRLACPDQPK